MLYVKVCDSDILIISLIGNSCDDSKLVLIVVKEALFASDYDVGEQLMNADHLSL